MLKEIFLGLIQGMTEFLPISSSGHLAVISHFINFENSLVFEVLLHFASLLAILIFFRKDISSLISNSYYYFRYSKKEYKEDVNLIIYIIIATIPAGIIGVLFDDFIENTIKNIIFIYFNFLLTGIILLSTKFIKRSDSTLNFKNSLIIGISQAIAILPGISRSGITISAGLLQNIDREKAARFSFFLAIPAIGGASLLKFKDLLEVGLDFNTIIKYSAGAFSSFIFSYIALIILFSLLKNKKFYYFGYYCITIGIFGILSTLF